MGKNTVLLLVLAAGAASSAQALIDGKSLAGWNQCNGNATYLVENGIEELR